MTYRRLALPFRGMLFAAALAAAVPTVRWCPLHWEQIDAERFLRCTTMVAAGLPSCGPVAPPPCAAAANDDCRTACAARLGVATCPLADAATRSAPRSTPAPSRHGHAYFLGDAAFAHALRSTPRPVSPPLRAAMLPVAVAPAQPTLALRRAPLAAEPRPPNQAPHAPPPARAPPLEA